jgi:hypothetical protein
MPILLDCPVCSQRLRVPNFAAGRITKCTACGNAVRVPEPKKMLEEGDDDDATKTAGDKPIEPFSISEIGPRSIEKLSGWLDWLAERPVRALVAAAIVVACGVGVTSAKWVLSKSPEAPVLSVEPEDPEPWEGVGATDANERVRVTAKSVTVEPIVIMAPGHSRQTKTPKAYLRIALKIENLGTTELKYTGWSGGTRSNEQMARMKDDTGIAHPQVAWKAQIVGQTLSAEPIQPSHSLEDVLVFNNPGTYARYLKLTLPAGACGEQGNLRIKIPRTRVLD